MGTLAATYAFSAPAAAKYLTQFIDAYTSYINHVPVDILSKLSHFLSPKEVSNRISRPRIPHQPTTLARNSLLNALSAGPSTSIRNGNQQHRSSSRNNQRLRIQVQRRVARGIGAAACDRTAQWQGNWVLRAGDHNWWCNHAVYFCGVYFDDGDLWLCGCEKVEGIMGCTSFYWRKIGMHVSLCCEIRTRFVYVR